MTESHGEKDLRTAYKESISNLCKIIAEERSEASLFMGSERDKCTATSNEFWSVYRHIAKSISAEKALRDTIRNANENGYDFRADTVGCSFDDPGDPVTCVSEMSGDGSVDVIHIATTYNAYYARARTRWKYELTAGGALINEVTGEAVGG